MKITHAVLPCTLLGIIVLTPAHIVSAQTMKPEMLAQFEQKRVGTVCGAPDGGGDRP